MKLRKKTLIKAIDRFNSYHDSTAAGHLYYEVAYWSPISKSIDYRVCTNGYDELHWDLSPAQFMHLYRTGTLPTHKWEGGIHYIG